MAQRKTEGPEAYTNARLNAKDAIREACEEALKTGGQVNSIALRAKYGLKAHPTDTVDPTREREWNELARIFVQRFQQIHNLPADSLAGPRSFEVLDATAMGETVFRGMKGPLP